MAAGNNKKMDIKKKILFLVTQSEFGGAQRFIHTLVINLDKNKYDIMVSAGLRGDDENGLLKLLESPRHGIKIERLKYLKRSVNPFFDFLGYFEIKKLIRKEKPDILFLCSSKAGFLGSLAVATNPKSEARNPKVIYRIGGWAFNDPRPKWEKKLYIWIEKVSAKWKDYIINNAESDKQQAIKIGIKPKKGILTIYNGIDADKLEFLNREEARKFLQLHNSDFVVGTIANDYPAKGLKYLKKAMEDVDGKLVIIGKGNKYIPDAYKYLKAFDVFVLPSVKEGFPWVLLEAIKAGIPVVATKVGAVPEIINEYIEPGNVDELVKAIKNPQKFKFNENFSLETMLKKYEDLFSLN